MSFSAMSAHRLSSRHSDDSVILRVSPPEDVGNSLSPDFHLFRFSVEIRKMVVGPLTEAKVISLIKSSEFRSVSELEFTFRDLDLDQHCDTCTCVSPPTADVEFAATIFAKPRHPVLPQVHAVASNLISTIDAAITKHRDTR